MSQISVNCPNCGQGYAFLASQIGTPFTCLECGDTFMINAPQNPPAQATLKDLPEPATSTAMSDDQLSSPSPGEVASPPAKSNNRLLLNCFLAAFGLLVLAGAIWFVASKRLPASAGGNRGTAQQALFDEALSHINNNDDIRLAKILPKIDAAACDSQGFTLLTHAVLSKEPDLVNIILNAGADINHLDNDGQSALFHACIDNNITITELLLNRGADVNARRETADSCVGVAAEAGFDEVLKLLLNHTQLLIEPAHKERAIFRAIGNNHVNCARQLLQKINVNVRDENGNTPLAAAVLAKNITLVRHLIVQGANPNLRNKAGETPIFIAMRPSYQELFSLFPPSIINWNETNNAGVTIPMLFAQAGDYEKLLQSLTDENAGFRDQAGCNVLFYAVTAKQNSLKMLKYLLRQNVDVSSPTLATSPLYAAIAHDNHLAAKYLLDIDCSLDGVDDDGNNLLMLAAKTGDASIVLTLEKKGVDLLAINKARQTALNIAINQGHDVVADFLKIAGEQQAMKMIRQTEKEQPENFEEYQIRMTQLDNLEDVAFGYKLALSEIKRQREAITKREVARQANVINNAIKSVANDTPLYAIEVIEKTIENCPLADNRQQAQELLQQLREKQQQIEERQKKIAAMTNKERETEINKLVNDWLGDMRVGRDTSKYWKTPLLGETLFNVQNWEIFSYSKAYQRATVMISSSTKGGYPIRVSWHVWFTRDEEGILKILLLEKM